jgi:hypothetical protein
VTPVRSPEAIALLEAQLTRMRAMIFRYYELFFRFINAGLVAIGALFVLAFVPQTQAAALLLPFVILYVGFHAASLFSYVIFGRTYAAAIERRLNTIVGDDILVAHRLEAVYFGSPADRRIVAASLRRPLTMLAAETWHFTIAGAALFAVGVLLGNLTAARLGEPWSTMYVPIAVGWAVVNGAYLAWYFIVRRDQRAMERILEEAYGEPVVTHAENA